MKRKTLGFILILLWAGSSIVYAQKKINHIVWADTGYDAVFIYEVPIPDPTARMRFESRPVLQFDVPASRTRSAIFFDWNGSLIFSWTGNEPRVAIGEVYYRFLSPVIPRGITVTGGFNILSETSNNSVEIAVTSNMRRARFSKHVLRKNNQDWWGVYDEITGLSLTEPEAKRILNALINAGFKVQVFASGHVQSVQMMKYIQVSVQVTGID